MCRCVDLQSAFAIWILTQADARASSLVTLNPAGGGLISSFSSFQRGLQGHYCGHVQ